MPLFPFRLRSIVATTASGVVDKLNGFYLRRESEVGVFDMDADIAPRATFTTEFVRMDSLRDIYGLNLDPRWLNGRGGGDVYDNLGIQVSIDNGATFLAWDGFAWAIEAEAGNYSTREEFDENIAALPIAGPSSLGFRIEILVDSDADDTPIVQGVQPYLWWNVSAFADIHETLYDSLSTFDLDVTRQQKMVAAAAAFVFTPNGVVNATGSFTVYNLTVDPTKTANVFLSYVGGTKTLTMSAVPAIGDVIEVNYRGGAAYAVVRRDEMIVSSELPFTMLMIGDIESTMAGRNIGTQWDYKLGSTNRSIRIAPHPVFRQVGVTMRYSAAQPRDAVAAGVAFSDWLNKGIQSIHTGIEYRWIEETAGDILDFASNSFTSGQWAGMLKFYEPPRDFREETLVNEFDLTIGDAGKWKQKVRVDLST